MWRTVILIFVFLTVTNCEKLINKVQQSNENQTMQTKGRSDSRADLIACAMSLGCLADRAEGFLEDTRRNLLVEADKEAFVTTGRQSEDSQPSHLASAIEKLIAELTGYFKDGLTGFFRNAKDDDEAEEDEMTDDVEEEKDEDKKEIHEESRGKKKKKKIKAIIKLLIIGMVIKSKIAMLLKLLAAHLQIKFLIIAVANLLINAAKFYFDLKKGHSPQKVIYYEHAQHQHHYDGGEEDWASPDSSGGYWARAYDTNEEKSTTAQDLAYSQQRPYAYSKIDNKPNFSWT